MGCTRQQRDPTGIGARMALQRGEDFIGVGNASTMLAQAVAGKVAGSTQICVQDSLRRVLEVAGMHDPIAMLVGRLRTKRMEGAALGRVRGADAKRAYCSVSHQEDNLPRRLLLQRGRVVPVAENRRDAGRAGGDAAKEREVERRGGGQQGGRLAAIVAASTVRAVRLAPLSSQGDECSREGAVVLLKPVIELGGAHGVRAHLHRRREHHRVQVGQHHRLVAAAECGVHREPLGEPHGVCGRRLARVEPRVREASGPAGGVGGEVGGVDVHVELEKVALVAVAVRGARLERVHVLKAEGGEAGDVVRRNARHHCEQLARGRAAQAAQRRRGVERVHVVAGDQPRLGRAPLRAWRWRGGLPHHRMRRRPRCKWRRILVGRTRERHGSVGEAASRVLPLGVDGTAAAAAAVLAQTQRRRVVPQAKGLMSERLPVVHRHCLTPQPAREQALVGHHVQAGFHARRPALARVHVARLAPLELAPCGEIRPCMRARHHGHVVVDAAGVATRLEPRHDAPRRPFQQRRERAANLLVGSQLDDEAETAVHLLLVREHHCVGSGLVVADDVELAQVTDRVALDGVGARLVCQSQRSVLRGKL
eukprot:5099443-Pleurochrysis_carterae.AAC.1